MHTKFIARFAAAALLTLGGAALAPAAHAQARVSVSIGAPAWGPALPAGAEYYYIPEVGGYYDVPTREYIVQRNGGWVRTRELRGYNPANFHPVVINERGRQPWAHYNDHRARYPRGGNNGGDHRDDRGRNHGRDDRRH